MALTSCQTTGQGLPCLSRVGLLSPRRATSSTPGRYVGGEEVEGEPFEEKMKRLVERLEKQKKGRGGCEARDGDP